MNKVKKILINKYPFLGKYIKADFGFRPDTHDERDHVLELGVSNPVLKENGQWLDSLPVEEKQKLLNSDSMSCVSQSLLNCVEMIFKVKFSKTVNYNDRYLAKLSNTTTRGNTMRNVAEAMRKYGAIDEAIYPTDTAKLTWAEYYKNIPTELIEKGELWLGDYRLTYKAVIPGAKYLMEALKVSPLWTCGYAWASDKGIYKSYGRANHAFTLVGYEKGRHWYAFDTYAPHVKKLDWDFELPATKTVFIESLKEVIDKEGKINTFKSRFPKAKYIMRVENKGEILDLDNNLKHINAKEWNNRAVKKNAKESMLIPVSEQDFNKLF